MSQWQGSPTRFIEPLNSDNAVIQQLISGVLPSKGPVSEITCLVCDQVAGERLITLVTVTYLGHADRGSNEVYASTYIIHADEIPEDPIEVFILAHEKWNFAPWASL